MIQDPNLTRVSVGDFVYFETHSTSPYVIRKVEELNVVQNKNVEVKCVCYYRRREIPSSLVSLADRTENWFVEDDDDKGVSLVKKNNFDSKEIHQLKHREVFHSRILETLPASAIRGKCSVVLLCAEENLRHYLNTNDSFFYSLVYDPAQKTLFADHGEIRVGSKFQADVIPDCQDKTSLASIDLNDADTLTWKPSVDTKPLNDPEFERFLTICRAVGLYARAIDINSAIRQPDLQGAVISASRDCTIQFAHDLLHKSSYDFQRAMFGLLPHQKPILCRDELEAWSPAEAALFEDGMAKHQKDFQTIRDEILPWKSMTSVVEFFYFYKTTDRFTTQRKKKILKADKKMTHTLIPNYSHRTNTSLVVTKKGAGDASDTGRGCESCLETKSGQWFMWGPPHINCRLCANCWNYWKSYGGLKRETRHDADGTGRPPPELRNERLQTNREQAQRETIKCMADDCDRTFRQRHQLVRHMACLHSLLLRSNDTLRPLVKTQHAFTFRAAGDTRLARRICDTLLPRLRCARTPFTPISHSDVQSEFEMKSTSRRSKDIIARKLTFGRAEHSMKTTLTERLNIDTTTLVVPDFLAPSNANAGVAFSGLKTPLRFPKPSKPFFSVEYYANEERKNQPSLLGKRNYQEISKADSPVPSDSNDTVPAKKANGFENGPNHFATHPHSTGPKVPVAVAPSNGSSGHSPVKKQPRHIPQNGGIVENGLPHSPLTNGIASNGNGTTPVSNGPVKGAGSEHENIYFIARDNVKDIRRQLTSSQMRQSCVHPFEPIVVSPNTKKQQQHNGSS